MTWLDLPYLLRIRSKGREYWYFRQGERRIRLPGLPGDVEFLTAYQTLITAPDAATAERPAAGTMAALIDEYRGSAEWEQLKPATHKDYLKFLPTFRERYGSWNVVGLTRAWVFKLRARYAKETSPRTANKAVACVSLLMSWAVNNGWRADNPALRPKRLKVTGEYRAWTDDEIERFLDGAPSHLALACLLGVGTGQRAADLVRMTWAAYRDGMIEVVQSKTGVRVWIPVHGRLQAALDRTERRAITILTAAKGRPYTSGNLSHDVHDRAVGLGIAGAVLHGWRKTATTWLVEAGCSPSEARSIIGHKTLAMMEAYSRSADQKRLAKAAVVKLRAARK